MKSVIAWSALLVAVSLLAAGGALADANCGNPCDDDEVWTDKYGGKCLPKPKGEPKTS